MPASSRALSASATVERAQPAAAAIGLVAGEAPHARGEWITEGRRRVEKGQAYGVVTAKALAVFEALLHPLDDPNSTE
jgi:hypothetical protein